MINGGWKYYQHAMLPSCKPHEIVNSGILREIGIWKHVDWKRALFAKYTEDWDCSVNTGWYWCIKDEPFNIMEIKSKYRYEIRKAQENFSVRVINPLEYANELFDVTVNAFSSYPKAYREIPNKEVFVRSLSTWKIPTFAAFEKLVGLKDGDLVGYITMVERDEVIYYSGQCVKKQYERLFVNHALIVGMLEHYKHRLASGCYIVDGERNINHLTNHQDFLEKKFGFRKAYCKLRVVYRPGIKWIVQGIYPFRALLRRVDNLHPLLHKINGVLLLEEVHRAQHSCKMNKNIKDSAVK